MADATVERTIDEVPTRTGLEVRRSPYGRGVFATRPFAAGETVEVCPTMELPAAEVVGSLADYVFGSGDDDVVVLVLGFGSLYNHSAAPSLEYVSDDPATFAFLTLRPVAPGEELTIDYGEEWWEGRGIVADELPLPE